MSIFRNVFQGGVCVEVFSPGQKNVLSNAFIAKNAEIVYDKLAKTLIYIFDGESIEKQVVIPKDSKKSLGLIQPYLILQLFRSGEKGFRLEVRIKCNNGSRKRITFSTHKADLQISTLSASVPFVFFNKSAWMHVCFNMCDIVSFLWKEHCQTIDEISLSGSFSIRRIYTVNKDMISDGSWERRYMEQLPKQYHFPLKVPQVCHLVSKLLLENIGCALNKTHTKGLPPTACSPADTNHPKKLSSRACSYSDKAKQSNRAKGSSVKACPSSGGIARDSHAKRLPYSPFTSRIDGGKNRPISTNVHGARSSKNCIGDTKNTEFDKPSFGSCLKISSISAPLEEETQDELSNETVVSTYTDPGNLCTSFCDGVEDTISNKLSKLGLGDNSSCYQMSSCSAPDRNSNFDVQDEHRNELSDDQLSEIENELSDSEDELAESKHLEVWLPSTSMDLADALSLARNLVKMETASCHGDK